MADVLPSTELWGSPLEQTGGMGSKFEVIPGGDSWSKFALPDSLQNPFDLTKQNFTFQEAGNPTKEGCSEKKTEEQTDPSKEQQKQPQINFGEHAKKDAVSDYSKQVLQDALKKSGNSKATISSTVRDPYNQARVMYDNLKQKGVTQQRGLYKKPGQMVIDVYESSIAAGKTREAVIQDMMSKINKLGPTTVSNHCGDPNVLQVIDVAPSSITNKQAFVDALKADHPRVSKILTPSGGDPAYHIEIPQPKK